MRINLDHQTATPLLAEVLAVMEPLMVKHYGNPASLHTEGIVARDTLAKARETVASCIQAPSAEQVIFTSSGTEAINLAIKGYALANASRGKHILFTASDQPALTASVKYLQSIGFEGTALPVDSSGKLSLDHLCQEIRPDTILICTHHANYDIGTIQPVAEIKALADEQRIPLFIDATASAGWLALNVEQLGASLLSFSPHTMGGPKGMGVLYRAPGIKLTPMLHGGVEEHNLAVIAGGAAALRVATDQLEQRTATTRQLQQHLWEQVSALGLMHRLNGPVPGPDRLPNNLNLSFQYLEGEALALMFDVRGIAIGSSTACVSKEEKIPPVLRAIGLDESTARGTMLLTLSPQITREEIDRFLQLLPKLVSTLREMSPEWDEFQRSLK